MFLPRNLDLESISIKFKLRLESFIDNSICVYGHTHKGRREITNTCGQVRNFLPPPVRQKLRTPKKKYFFL